MNYLTTPFLQTVFSRITRGYTMRDAVKNTVSNNLSCQLADRWGQMRLNREPTFRRLFGQAESNAEFMAVKAKFERLGRLITQAINEGDGELLLDTLSEAPAFIKRYLIIDNWTGRNGELEYFTCHCCAHEVFGEAHGSDECDNLLCESCVERDYLYSSVMGAYVHSGVAWPVYDCLGAYERQDADDWVTSDFGRHRRDLLRPDNGDHCFFSSEEAYEDWYASYYDNDYDEDDDDSRSSRLIQDYHSGDEVGHIPSAYDKRKPGVWMGLELEIECGSNIRDEIAESINNHVNTDRRYVMFEEDGSLSHGFEVISGYTGLDTHEAWLKRFANANLKGCKSHDTNTCGLHVHITKADLSPFEAARLMLFIHNPSNEKLIRAVARRYGKSAGYAKFVDKTASIGDSDRAIHAAVLAKNNLTCMNYDRYEALNFQPRKTVEFRLYRGTLKVETIMACLEFTWLSYFFAKQTSITHLGTEDFIKWISLPQNKRESRYLRRLLRAKGIIPAASTPVALEAETSDGTNAEPPEPRLRRCEREALAA